MPARDHFRRPLQIADDHIQANHRSDKARGLKSDRNLHVRMRQDLDETPELGQGRVNFAHWTHLSSPAASNCFGAGCTSSVVCLQLTISSSQALTSDFCAEDMLDMIAATTLAIYIKEEEVRSEGCARQQSQSLVTPTFSLEASTTG